MHVFAADGKSVATHDVPFYATLVRVGRLSKTDVTDTIVIAAPGPGRQHETIEEAQIEADADGTRSILDIDRVANEPDFGVAQRLTEEELQELLGTTTPTGEQVLEIMPP